ncbi:MAG: aminodeoxychorismate/anthranilate synthase component II [Acidimicrobiaceae bacterium]|nr:aminodeoxychorismate/anthranilate synthase component II [Acidimicrobiaceae bacterium]
MARIVVVDNYDSFVYNLVQYLGELGAEPIVYRNDAIGIEALADLAPDGILLSPGPGRPEDAGITPAVISAFAGKVPVLGVCLGHQAIGAAFGGRVVRTAVMHGKTSTIDHDGRGVFAGMPRRFTATRYHSLTVDPDSVAGALEISATADDGTIMGIRHRHLAVEGVQFHPESVLTTGGHRMIANWLATCGQPEALDAVPTLKLPAGSL